MTDTSARPHVLDDPPPFHSKLTNFGVRPYWSPAGDRIAFVEKNFGDISELDMATREVKSLTRDLGEFHSFLRVLFLANGDYLLIGPPDYKDLHTSRHIDSEMWVMDRQAKNPPYRLGQRIFEGAAVSTIANRISYTVSHLQDPELAEGEFHVHVTELAYDENGRAHLGEDRIVHRGSAGSQPEPQDFRHDDTEIIMTEYMGTKGPDGWDRSTYRSRTSGVSIVDGTHRVYMEEPHNHNECEGIFPDHDYICVESTCDTGFSYPPRNLWKVALDGSQRRVRMTQMPQDHSWKATNSNVSPDGRWLAYMVAQKQEVSGFGQGLGLLDLTAWEADEAGQRWETPIDIGEGFGITSRQDW